MYIGMQPRRFYADAKRVETVTGAPHARKKLDGSRAYINVGSPSLHVFMLM